jgi:tetratricopeptide (TPR) repeat protein/Tol biopolymer transport system component
MRIDWGTYRSAVWPERRGMTAVTKNLGVLLAFSVIAAMAQAQTATIAVDYPGEGSIFPPEITPPTFLFRDSSGRASRWRIDIDFGGRAPAIQVESKGERLRVGEIDPRCVSPNNELPKLTPEQASAHTWMPDAAIWAVIKKQSVAAPATVTITGLNGSGAVSSGRVGIRTSSDPVGAPIFYRDVPLMPSATEKGVIKPLAQDAIPLIQWSVRNIGETRSRVVLTGMPTCANCHSFSLDGKTMGMDLDGPQNDKGLYALAEVKPRMSIRNEDMISWNPSQDKQFGLNRVGFMSQVSPDGQYVLTTVSSAASAPLNNFYVVNFRDYRFLQVFYPTRGILAWYSRATGRREPLPGADDPRYVQTDGVWSPDGKYIVFARAGAKEPYPADGQRAGYANDPAELRIQYDLYRVAFNGGKGGVPEPVGGASANGMSNTFPKVSPDGRWIVFVKCKNGQLMRPDSQLYIVPAQGGEARRMRCNTPLMNSWHSFSPNGRWLVFSSKSRSPYTQMYLTHIGPDGNDSPAILIDNTTAANRAVNLPEFVNIPPDGLTEIATPAVEMYKKFDHAFELGEKGQYQAAIAEWSELAALNPDDARIHNNLGTSLARIGRFAEAIQQYERALELNPQYYAIHNSLGAALIATGQPDEAIAHFQKALEVYPEAADLHNNLGRALAMKERLDEAMAEFQKAAEIDPQSAEARNNAGRVLASKGRLEDAIPYFQKAVEIDPDYVEAQQFLGAALYYARGQMQEALAHWRAALRVQPDFLPALNEVAHVLAACPEASARNGSEAVTLAERAVELSGGQEALYLDTLAAAYAEAGRFADAVETARRGLEIATRKDQPQLREGLAARLRLYEARKPYRDAPRQ